MSIFERRAAVAVELRPFWSHVRAALIFAHIVAVVVLALPHPGAGMNRSAWADPTVQAEFVAWSDRLGELGIRVPPATLEHWAWENGLRWVRARRALVAPFGPYVACCGVRQPWRMFVAPDRFPSRLAIDGEIDGRWTELYRARSPQFTWGGEVLDHDRLRAALFRYAWAGYEADREALVAWIGHRAARDLPDVDRVRVRIWKEQTRTPQQVRAGAQITRERIFERVLDLGRWR